jgi:hypothetical protein
MRRRNYCAAQNNLGAGSRAEMAPVIEDSIPLRRRLGVL